MHFANIVTNWRCNIKHQELDVPDNKKKLNKPQENKLKFEFSSTAYCGLFTPECAEITLRSFMHYYNEKLSDKYMFSGHELLYS